MLSTTPGQILNEYLPDYCLFDLETTGVSCRNDSIIEISAVRVRDGRITAEFSQLVNPERPIPYDASAVNNITDEMVEDAPVLEQVMPAFLDFIGNDVLAGHNIAAFDMKFLYRDCLKLYGQVPDNNYTDTLKYARQKLPQAPNHRLVTLAQYYGISSLGAHRALNDCRMNHQVFVLLSKETGAPQIVCPKCGNAMVLRSGRYGRFLGCTGYPNCRHTEKV